MHGTQRGTVTWAAVPWPSVTSPAVLVKPLQILLAGGKQGKAKPEREGA